jgi:hypothetical protein
VDSVLRLVHHGKATRHFARGDCGPGQ